MQMWPLRNHQLRQKLRTLELDLKAPGSTSYESCGDIHERDIHSNHSRNRQALRPTHLELG